jgi:hypothetical protein
MSIKNAIVLLIIISILCTAFYFIKDGIIKSNTQVIKKDFIFYQQQIDSLISDIYSKELMISRYEITLELLKEEDPQAAEKFQSIYNKQTE